MGKVEIRRCFVDAGIKCNQKIKRENVFRTWRRVGRWVALVIGMGWTVLAVAAPFAYVTDFVSNTVSVIDTATNTVIGSPIPVGRYPHKR